MWHGWRFFDDFDDVSFYKAVLRPSCLGHVKKENGRGDVKFLYVVKESKP